MMISSKQNSLIKEIRSLSDKKFRDKLGLFTVEGIKSVNEAIVSSLKVDTVIATEKAISSLVTGEHRFETVTEEVFKSVSEEVTPQGALATVFKPKSEICSPSGSCLILDGVSDPGNVGAIIRTAAASGYNEVYMTEECADAFSSKAVRASMGGIFRVKIMRGKLSEILEKVNLPICVADMGGEDVFKFNNKQSLCLVIGNEGHGVSEQLKKRANFTVQIPMENGVESLNAAVSAGILMYCLKK